MGWADTYGRGWETSPEAFGAFRRWQRTGLVAIHKELDRVGCEKGFCIEHDIPVAVLVGGS